ncbi:MAG: GNAT family N-acetyltransferase [Flavobacteriales bacterium]|nr:GNAT family N-acetyltransferase [Flavobacteriales bacterium]
MKVVFLEKSHNRSQFKCEENSLTEYIQKQASQDIKKGLAACFVIPDDQDHVIGYYTLANESLDRTEIPEQYQKKVPKSYNVPVTLLGRLACDISKKGSDIGEHLLLDALHRCSKISKESIGSMAVVVDPLSQFAVDFYLKYGFIYLPDSGRMFLPMKTIDKLFK